MQPQVIHTRTMLHLCTAQWAMRTIVALGCINYRWTLICLEIKCIFFNFLCISHLSCTLIHTVQQREKQVLLLVWKIDKQNVRMLPYTHIRARTCNILVLRKTSTSLSPYLFFLFLLFLRLVAAFVFVFILIFILLLCINFEKWYKTFAQHYRT